MEQGVGHVILLGDSIFDNARYVPDRPPVIEQLRRCLPSCWSASLLAVDGHTTEDVANQLTGLPNDATHLIVSAGGNDALAESAVLGETVASVAEALGFLHEVYGRFRRCYRAMLKALAAANRPTVLCTVYNAIPGLAPADQVALAGFNEVILQEAFLGGLPVIDLRLVCNQSSDYSPLSPIEPSMAGGSKIARVITDAITTHDFGQSRSIIFT